MHPVPASITVRVEVAVHCVDITRCFEVERNPALVQVHSINIILGAKKKTNNRNHCYDNTGRAFQASFREVKNKADKN